MLFFKENTIPMKCARKVYAAFPDVDESRKEFIYTGIQVTVSAALASYTFEDPTYKVLPYMFSAVALGGTYNVLKSMQKKPKPLLFLKLPRAWSWWDLANGIFTFTTSVYAFSEGLTCNDRMWIPCLPLAASGFYCASTTVSTLNRFLNRKPLLKCCQLMFDPALVVCASIYLFHFRGHKEGWLKFIPFLVIGNAGFNIVDRGCRRDGTTGGLKHLQLKVIEMFLGGCYLTISSTALAIYSSANDLFWLWTVIMSLVSLYGSFCTLGSIMCLRFYLRMDSQLFYSTVGMFVGPLAFSLSFVMMEYTECDARYIGFLFLNGTGQLILYASLYELYFTMRIPRRLLFKYCQGVFGPLLTIYSSGISAYTAYRLGWQFCLLPMLFIPAGMYATYRGFRKEKISAP